MVNSQRTIKTFYPQCRPHFFGKVPAGLSSSLCQCPRSLVHILVSVRVRDSLVPPGLKEESSFLICVPAPSGGQQGPAGTNNAPPTPLHLTQKTHAGESCRLHEFTIVQWFNVPRQKPPRSVLRRLEYRLKSR